MKKMKLSKNQKGVTLVEVIIYMAIFSGLLLILTDLFVSTTNLNLDARGESAVSLEGRAILNRISYDINRSTSIDTPASPGDLGSTLEVTIGGETITYSLNNQVLEVTDTSGTYSLTGSEVNATNLQFTKLGNPLGAQSIRINMTLESVASSNTGKETRNFTGTAASRH